MKKLVRISLTSVFALFLLLGSLQGVLAQSGGTPGQPSGGTPGSVTPGSVTFQNPLGANVTYRDVVANVIKGVLGVVGVAALIVFIYGGLVWMTSLGNSERVRQGRDTLVWGTLGLVVVFASFAVVNLILSALEN